jgi:hypothetical protein
MKWTNVDSQTITKVTMMTYPLRIADDNYISILRATYTQTPMPLRKQSKQRKSTNWCLEKEKTVPKQNIENFKLSFN